VQICSKSVEDCKRSGNEADNEYAGYTGAFQCMVSTLLYPLGRASWLSVSLAQEVHHAQAQPDLPALAHSQGGTSSCAHCAALQDPMPP